MPDANPFDRLCVVLVSTRNPLNIGAVARAMCNFGVSDLRVVRPYDPAFREARSAVGAGAVLENAHHFDNLADAVADCTLVVGTVAAMSARNPQHRTRSLVDGAASIRAELANGERHRVAIVFGSEKRGLSNLDLSSCHWQMYIATRVEQPSMNLGQAGAVCLYELTRYQTDDCVGKTSDRDRPAPASSGDLDRLETLLRESLDASGYLYHRPVAHAEEWLRRLVRRLNLSAEDAAVWLGVFRQIAWKLRTGKRES